MFKVNEDKSIYVTRGDYCDIPIPGAINGKAYQFQIGDVLRFKVTNRKDCNTVVMQRDFEVEEAADTFNIRLNDDDTRIGEVISKPTDYWYEVELNPDGDCQTIIGYDEDGPKIFKLFPEGKDVTAEDIDVVGKQTIEEIILELMSEGATYQEAINEALAIAKESGEFDGPRGYKGDRGSIAFPLIGVHISSDNGTIESANEYIRSEGGNFYVHGNPQAGDAFYTTAGDLCYINSMSSDGKGGYNLHYRRIANLRGPSGVAGKTPVKGVDYFDGADGKDGYTPVKGEDYFTEEEKTEIAELAAEMVEVPEGGSGVYILADGETIADAPADADVIIDPNGDADLDIGGVKTVNGVAPDENGNVEIETGGVKSVNGVTPDANGNVQIETGGGGASSLEDLLPAEVILPKTNPVHAEGFLWISEAFTLVEGEEYIVNWNGTDYRCICTPMEYGGMAGLGLGNIGAVTGGANTGEPFVVAALDEESAAYTGFPGLAADLTGATSATVSINAPAKIPDEYLPEKVCYLYGATGTYNYLYNSPDTSNALNRTTAARLRKLVENGTTVWFVSSDSLLDTYVPCHISFNKEFGYGAIMIGIPGLSATNATYFTAEFEGQT